MASYAGINFFSHYFEHRDPDAIRTKLSFL